MSPRLAFVASSAGNLFMHELLELLADGARARGVQAEVVLDRWPEPEPGLACVAVPHETFGFLPPSGDERRRTVALCTEQPGTTWFERAAAHAATCGAVVDVSRVGVLGLRREGITAAHVQLGWCPALEAAPRHAERPVDVLYMGSAAPRREVLLSGYADVLWPWRSRLLIPPHWAKTRERGDFVVGDRKRALVAGAKLLLSVRRQPEGYFEWLRALDAIAGGAVLVAEHGAGFAPLVPGEHLVLGGARALGLLAEGLLRDPARREAIAAAALAFVRAELPMGIDALMAAAEQASAQPLTGRGERAAPVAASGPESPARAPDDPVAAAAARRAITERRAAERAAATDPDALEELHRTPAYAACSAPRVAVCVPAYQAAATLEAALRSVARQTIAPDLELLVHDDHCPDGSGELAATWARRHPELAVRVVRRAANAGLPAGRNALTALARARYVLALDADNELLPPCAERLADALDADPEAAFAYPILAVHAEGEPAGLLSSLAWDPELLAHFNPIDALALLRLSALEEAGGWTEDLDLYGWEDWDLWCALAARGRHGVHVPELLARYRRAPGSMLATTDLDQHAKLGRLAQRHPSVFSRN